MHEPSKPAVTSGDDRLDAMTELRAELATQRRELAAAVEANRQLALVHEDLERRVAEAEVRVAGPSPDPAPLDQLVAARLEGVERRLADQIVGQWGDLETAIEAAVRRLGDGLARGDGEDGGAQAELARRLEILAAEVARATQRMDAIAARLGALEHRPGPVPGELSSAPPAPAEGLLETLERQLDAAASRLAARADQGPGD